MVVVGNKNSTINSLNKEQLANLYLGKINSINGNMALIVYNLPQSSQQYTDFYKEILGWSGAEVSGYWSQQLFSGYGSQPATFNNPAQVLQTVASNTNAIGYVDTADLAGSSYRDQVKILYGDQPVKQPTRAVPTPAPQAVSPADAQDSGNLWQEVIQGFQLNHYVDEMTVRQELLWYSSRPGYVQQLVNNASPFLYYIYHQAKQRGLPTEFVLLPMVESDYNANAYSETGAAGFWQMMPATASLYGLDADWWYDQRRDIPISTHAALDFLVNLHRDLHDWLLVAAAYDAGEGAVQTAMQYNARYGRRTDFFALPLPYETRAYVPKLLALAHIIRNADQYGIILPVLPDKPYFSFVNITSQMDLGEIARYSGASIATIQLLNPGLRRYATSPGDDHTILLPVANANTLVQTMQNLVGKTHVSWQYHEVRAGEDLVKIAKNYHQPLALIQQANNMSGTYVHPGDGILVPIDLDHRYKLPVIVSNEKIASQIKSVAPSVPETAPIFTPPPVIVEPTQPEVTRKPTTPIKSTDSLQQLLQKIYQ